MSRTRSLAALAVVPLIVLAAACGDDSGKASEPPADVTVAASAPVEARLKSLVDRFKTEHPELAVKFTTQDQDTMISTVKDKEADVAVLPVDWLRDPSIAPKPLEFATNNAVIVVPSGNPKHVTGLDAFKDGTSLRTQVCGTPSPIGMFILLAMKKNAVTPAPDTVAQGCSADAAKAVAAGDLDAAAMYRFGLRAPDGTEVVTLPPDEDLPFEVGTYVLSDDADVEAFVDFLNSDEVRKIMDVSGYVAG